MSSVEPRILRGFRDYLPREMAQRQRMLETLERVFRDFGYLSVMTPALEYSDILLGKYGEEADTLLYRFLDNGERDVALRYDLTVPLARLVAQYPDLPRPFRRYQIAPVWRAEKPGRGRYREFFQCDGDIVGSSDILADAEVIQLGGEMLRSLGFDRFQIRVNNRKILTGLMEEIGVSPGGEELAVLRTIDKLPKIGPEEAKSLLRKENGLEDRQVEQLFSFLGVVGTPREILDHVAPRFPEGSVGSKGTTELRQVLDLLQAMGLEDRVTLDLSIARGLNYYTGTIYETFLEDLAGFGSVMSGGRYDGLIGCFAREEIPGVGISLGIDRLVAGLKELNLVGDEEPPVRILVTVFGPETATLSARIARDIRTAGFPCELYPQLSKLGKQLRYAERTGKRFVVIAGPDEAAENAVQIKDLSSRSQEQVTMDRLVGRIGELLG